MTEETARTILVVCRQYAEHGKELTPQLLAELEHIATSDLNWSVRAEAECLIELERMA